MLDLFAGAGFLGIEAISRGAPAVDFVERDRAACDVIRRNLDALDVTEEGRVFCLPVERARRRLGGPYGLCFVDPPYRDDASSVVEAIAKSSMLAPGALLLWRHPRAQATPERVGPLARQDTRRYGDAVLDSYSAAPAEPIPGLRAGVDESDP